LLCMGCQALAYLVSLFGFAPYAKFLTLTYLIFHYQYDADCLFYTHFC
jgi:hypothetical protein